MPEDNVVQELYLQQLSRLNSLPSESDVILTWRRVPARVVVRHCELRSPAPDGVTVDLCKASGRRADRTAVEHRRSEDMVLRVQDHQTQFFLLKQLHLSVEKGGNLLRARHLHAVIPTLEPKPAAEFERRRDRRRLRLADPMRRSQSGEVSGPKSPHPSMLVQETLGQRHHTISRGASTEQDGKKFVCLERLWAEALKPLPRPLLAGHLSDAQMRVAESGRSRNVRPRSLGIRRPLGPRVRDA